MNFDIPQDLQDYLNELDRFIADTIKPLENETTTFVFRPSARRRSYGLGARRFA